MWPKRQKPKHGKSSARSGASGSKYGKREFARREFGRQIDADLTEAREAEAEADPSFDNSAGFTGAEFPEINEGPESTEPVITHSIVRERAMRLLVNREHGRRELEKKLRQRELPQELIDSVLDQLAEEGLQCDARFAESYTRMRVDRGFGANKIRADLQTRQLEQSVIEEAIRDSGAEWTALALAALDKKFGDRSAINRGGSVDSRARDKMQRFLYQRGFEASEIRSAINNFFMK